MKNKYLVLIAILLLASLVLIACGGKTGTTTTVPPVTNTTTAPSVTTTTTAPVVTTTAVDKYGGIWREAILSGPSTPIGYPPETDPGAAAVAEPAIECFINIKPGGIIEPILATEVKADPANNTVTLTLRQGVKFHDGTDFNATAAKWNLDKNIEVGNYSEFEDMSVDVIDNYTVRIHVKAYKNTLLSYLAKFAAYGVISPTAVETNGLEWARWNPVGTGPFKFVRYDVDSKVVYERNPDYWDPGKPYLNGVEFVVIPEATVQILAFEQGEIDVFMADPTTAIDFKEKGFPYLTLAGPTFVLIPDSTNADSPLAKKDVRLAVSYAINREELAETLAHGFANPAYQLWPGLVPLDGLQKTSYDPDKARQLLADAGYSDGFDTTIHGFMRVVPQDYLTALAAMLGEVGIRVTTDFTESGRYAQLRGEGWDDGFMGHCLASDINLNSAITFYFGPLQFPSVQKPAGWQEALDASLNSPNYDPDKVKAILQLISDNMMVIPYLEQITVAFTQKGVHDTGVLDGWAESRAFQNIWYDPEARHN